MTNFLSLDDNSSLFTRPAVKQGEDTFQICHALDYTVHHEYLSDRRHVLLPSTQSDLYLTRVLRWWMIIRYKIRMTISFWRLKRRWAIRIRCLIKGRQSLGVYWSHWFPRGRTSRCIDQSREWWCRSSWIIRWCVWWYDIDLLEIHDIQDRWLFGVT